MNSIENPWAGLSAYQDPETSQSPLKFCGRDNDSFDVTQLTDDNLFVTLYGKSGVGKTSLLNAGVFPRLRSLGYLPMSIRLGMESEGVSFQACIISKLSATLVEKGCHTTAFNVTSMPSNDQSQEYLWSFFARNHFTDKNHRPVFPVFVLDQFEEVFKKRKSDAEALLRQIDYLMDESHALADRIVDGQSYIYDYNYRFVLSIREDDLYSLEDSIDNNYLAAMKRCRYRLRGLSAEGAREAIVQPGEELFDKQEQEQIVNAIINASRNSDDGSISTNVLSLICSRLYLESRKSGQQQISALLVSNYLAANPFEKYYNEATSGMSNKERSYIERHLIDSSGRRNSISESDFFLRVKNGEKLLEGPQKILQRVSVSSDSKDNRIELIHDSFCAPLAELRQKRLLRRRLRMFFVSMCVTTLSVVVAAYIFYQNRQVEQLNTAMLENNSRFVSEKASMLVDEGDSYTARLFALAVLSPKRPYVIEAEAALRKASYHNTAVLKGHTNKVLSVTFSEDGKQIISTSTDSTIVWDALNGKLLKASASSQSSIVIASDISPDGTIRADIVNTTDIVISNIQNKRVIATLEGHSGQVNMVRFSPDGGLLASASDDNTIKLWDVNSGKEKRTFVGHSNYVTCLSFSPNGNRLVSGSEDNTVRIWDVYGNNAERIKLEDGNQIINSSFSSDGKYIASASFFDGLITIWDTKTGKEVHSFNGDKHIQSICFHPTDKRILATSAGKTIKIWNIEDGSLLHTLSEHHENIRNISFNQDGRYLASASSDKTVMVWDTQSYKHLKTLSGHTAKVNHVSFSNDGNMIATASDDKTIKVWSIENGDCLKTLAGHYDGVKYVSFSPKDEQLVSASDGNTVRIWDIETKLTVKTFRSHNGKMIFASFLSEDIMITASNDGLIRAWDIPSGTRLCDLDGYIDETTDNMLINVFVAPERHLINSVYFDGICERWTFPSLQELIQNADDKIRDRELSYDQKKKLALEK